METGHALVPEANALDHERFQVYSRIEIVALLRAVADARIAVTVYFNQGAEFIVTNVLSVNPEFEELILDLGADARANQRLLQSARMNVVTFLDHIRLQFQVQRAEETVHEQLPALRVRLPEVLTRLQRRNFYRLRASVVKPVCATFVDPSDRARRASLRILDLSCGGVALVSGAGDPELEVGAILEDCRIDLPEVGILTGALEVRSAGRHEEGARANQLRYGCQFFNLAPALANAVQRYITKTERERRLRL
ncbi:MAG: flagellar brake protein [Betaproteobacteria bacterium]